VREGSREITVLWTPVEGISTYDLQWRQEGEEEWQSTRTGMRQRFTLGDLVQGAHYSIRVRGVRTGGEADLTVYVTGWSVVESGIAGDWAPQNLRAMAGAGVLTVTWDDVPAATGYEVMYWRATDRIPRSARAVPMRDERGWRVEITDLAMDRSYVVAVRSVRSAAPRRVPVAPGERMTSRWATITARTDSYLGGRMWTFNAIGVLYGRIRGIDYSLWWSGSCAGEYVLWSRRASAGTWSLVQGVEYTGPHGRSDTYYLREPDLEISTRNSFPRYRAVLAGAEGRRFQLRCMPASESPPRTAEMPPGVLLGEVVFYRGSKSPAAPPNVRTETRLGGDMVVSWDGFPDAERARVRSSIVDYDVRWSWSDGDETHTVMARDVISPLDRSYTIEGLTPGREYEVQVRARSSTHDGAWSTAVTETAVGGIFVDVIDSDVPRFVRSGNTVTMSLKLLQDDGSDLAGMPLGVQFISGPSSVDLVAISCGTTFGGGVVGVPNLQSDECMTNGLGLVALTYTVGNVASDHEGWSYDRIRLHVDEQSNNRHDATEPSAEFTMPIAEPIDYVALGDSYSAGENGEYRAPGGFGPGFGGTGYYTNGASFDCHRWDMAYPILVANSDLNVNRGPSGLTTTTRNQSPIGFYACTGAITLNIFHSMDTNNDGVPDSLGTAKSILATGHDIEIDEANTEGIKHRTIDTNRPSASGSVPEFRLWVELDDQDENWESRQVKLLRQANAVRPVDMVTLTIGGNDLGFAAALTRCLVPDVPVAYFPFYASDAVLGSVRCYRDGGFDSRVRDFRKDVAEVLGAIQAVLSDAVIFVLGYPYLVPLDGRKCTGITMDPVLDIMDNRRGFSTFAQFFANFVADREALNNASIDADERVFVREAGREFNAVIQDEVNAVNRNAERNGEQSRVHFVDVAEVFEGHYVCGDKVDDNQNAGGGESAISMPRGLWMNGMRGDSRSTDVLPVSGRSFHPTIEGHAAYASILANYIRERVGYRSLNALSDRRLTTAGLPLAERGSVASSQGAAATDRAVGREASTRFALSTAVGGSGVLSFPLFAYPAEGADTGCGVLWSPGERVEVAAFGFEPGSAVSWSVVGGTAQRLDGSVVGSPLDPFELPSGVADGEGRAVVVWELPAPGHGSTPVWYAAKAEGTAESGEDLVARLLQPIVVYPGVQPCAFADAAVTVLGVPVRVDVLANDVAPAGGVLDPASVEVESAFGGEFVVDPVDGSVTFTPDPGFAGTASATYAVLDPWGVGVRADVSVTVEAGCSITGGMPEGDSREVLVVGTAGDDVICLGELEDGFAYRVEAGAGDDVVLGGAGDDVILGGPGEDSLFGRGGNDHLEGGLGADVIYGGEGFDTVVGTDRADTVVGTEGWVPATSPQ